MPLFVVRSTREPKRSPHVVDSPLVPEVLAIFQSHLAAEEFLRSSPSSQELKVTELVGPALLTELVDAWRGGIRRIDLHPDSSAQGHAHGAISLDLRSVLDEASLAPESKLELQRAPASNSDVKVVLYHCPVCGAVVEQRAGHSNPSCCRQLMSVAIESPHPPAGRSPTLGD